VVTPIKPQKNSGTDYMPDDLKYFYKRKNKYNGAMKEIRALFKFPILTLIIFHRTTTGV
jgi:hypothetical protein